ncbi:MAG: ribonuclease H-like domain-containing protein [Nanoarchaeota archaeon]|nr:ribonuclease H-like domain-containing protein [Nanoarchaeota archaeon]
MKMEFIPVDYASFEFEGKNHIEIFGRGKDGKKICVIDSFEPYFWVILKENLSEKKIKETLNYIKLISFEDKGREIKVIKTEICEKNFLGKKVRAIKVFANNYKDLHEIAGKVGLKEVEKRRGYDLGLITSYIKEKKIYPMKSYMVSGDVLNNSDEFGGIDSVLDVDFVIKLSKKEEINGFEIKKKSLAYDIETDSLIPEKGEILMISLVGENFKKVITWKKKKTENKYVEFVKNEKELLEKFSEYVKKYSPDFLVGYHSDVFDLPFIKTRAKILKVEIPLGIDSSEPKISKGVSTRGKITGITHIDLLKFIKTTYSQYMQSESLSLNEVSKEFLGDTKKEFSHQHSSKIKESDWEKYYEYNLHDSVLTLQLFEKFWPDLLEFSKIIGEPIFDISRNGLSKQIESYVIHNLDKFNEIPEKRPGNPEIEERKKRGKVEGAFVYEPKSGLYEKLAMFDFTSMHTSIIISHNISKGTLTNSKKDSISSPEIEIGGKKTIFYFSKKPGFFPTLLKEIFEKRKKYKDEYKKNPNLITKARSNAFKLLSASAHGYVGFFGARYYSWEASSTILAFVRKYNIETIKKIEEAGHKVIYGDSVSGNTKIWVRKNNSVKEIQIKDLFKKIDQKDPDGKEYDLLNGIETLTIDENGKSVFKPLKYIMRHKTNKKMYRINLTNNWHLDVTEDHSLIGYQANNFNQSKKLEFLNRLIEVKPEEIGKKVNSLISLKKIPSINNKSKNYPQEIYEIMGLFIGDGSFEKKYYLNLSLGLDKEELLEKIIKPLIKKGYIKNIWSKKNRRGDIRLNGLKLIKILKENCEKDKKKIFPEFLFEEKEENIASFLRGYFSADGTVMLRNDSPIIKLTSINEDFIEKTKNLLFRIGVSNSHFKENKPNFYKVLPKIYSNGSVSKHLIIKDSNTFMKKVGFLLERKNSRGNIKTNGNQKKRIKNFEFDLQGVKKIEEIKTPGYVYDIEVEKNHRFFANNCLVHNTDSVAFTMDGKNKKEIKDLLEKLNKELPGVMHIELENFFGRGLWVKTRSGKSGAKKKYALIDEEGNIKIRGFETVRRDWCQLARKTQDQILRLILKNGDEKKALIFLREVIERLKSGKVSKEDIMIKSQIKKPIEEYKSITPHVVAAKKMKEKGIPFEIFTPIEYYVSETNTKSKLVRDKIKLKDEPGKYDLSYYLEKQILPSVENIFEVFGINVKEVASGKKQDNLKKWF